MQATSVEDGEVTKWSVAYVMTHYPAVALTFIAGEVDEIERQGGHVFPIAINSPSFSDLATESACQRESATLYLKASAMTVTCATFRCLVRHPLHLIQLALRAARSARADVALIARRLVHLSYATLVAERCRQRRISHIHAQFGQAPATVAWLAAEICNFRSPATTTWSFTIHGFQDFVDEAVARLDLKAATARFVVCVSDFTKSQLCRVTRVGDWRKYHVVRCGIDLKAFGLREQRVLGPVPRIIIVGRLSPEKGHLILFQAVAELKKRCVEVEVEVVGGGAFEGALKAEVAALGIKNRVVFKGELEAEQVRRCLSNADLFCMASFAEGLPISIMEAMATGVPVVTTWIGGIPELAVHGHTALTIPPGNATALAEAIEHVVKDSDLRERLVSAARAAVEQAHRREVNVRRLIALFQPTLSQQDLSPRYMPVRAEG